MYRHARILLLHSICLAACAADDHAGSPLSQSAAADLVIAELVDDGDRVIVYQWAEPLGAERQLLPTVAAGFDAEPAIAIADESWMFWRDSAPGAAHGHDGEIVLVDRKTGELSTTASQWRPAVDGVVAWATHDEFEDPANFAWAPDDVRAALEMREGLVAEPTAPRGCAAGFGTGIVINGSDPGNFIEDDMTTSAKQVQAAMEELGFTMAYSAPRGGGGDKGVDYGAYIEQQAMTLKPGDTFVIYLVGHGGTDNGITGVGGVFEDDLAQKLSRIPAGVHIDVIIEGCHSGGMIDSLSCVADLTVTATDAEHNSHGDLDRLAILDGGTDPDPEDEGMEFTSAFVRSLRELMADPAKVQAITAAAAENGVSFTEQLLRDAFNRSRMYDVCAIDGAAVPLIKAGSAKTKPDQPPPPPEPPMCTPTGCATDVAPQVGALATTVGTTLQDPALTERACSGGILLPTGNSILLSTGVVSGNAIGAVDYKGVVALGSSTLTLAPNVLSCNSADHEVVRCADPSAPLPSEAVVVALAVDTPSVPKGGYHQYAVVFDVDGDDANNYTASPEYPADFFLDTDRWYELLGDPSGAWTLKVTDASNGKFIPVTSGARVMFDQGVLLWLIPGEEIGLADAELRGTAFEHQGDYGATMPWSGDLTTAVDLPMLRLAL